MNIFTKTFIFFQIFFFIQVSIIICAKNKLEDIFKDAEEVKCGNKTERKTEKLMEVLLPVGTDHPFPETPKEMRKYCNLANKSTKFVLGTFKYCSTPFGKATAKVMFFPIIKQLNGMCRPGQPSRMAREFMAAGKCGNLARQPLRKCNEKLIDFLMVIPSAPLKSMIPMICCHSNAFRLCVREATEETVGCTRHTVDWAEKFVMKVVGGAVDMVCGEYFDESDKCSKVMDKTPKPQYSKSSKRPQTFFKPLITFMEGFPDLDQKELD